VSGPETGGARFCPNCGTEVAGAKFCPECGTDLAAVHEALQRGAEGTPKSGRQGGSPRATAVAPPAGRAVKDRAAAQAGIPRWILIGGAAAAALVIIAVVLYAVLGPGGGATGGGTTSTPSPVAADTSGTYAQLIDRGNGLYDQGSSLFSDGKVTEAATYFTAAAKVYEAAWQKQPGDPNLGTDWATSLFYAGDITAAVKQVDMVLAKNPDFQPALYNKGNFLEHAARLAEDGGKTSDAATLKAQAKAAYEKAAAVDPTSAIGKQAAAAAKAL
jgi:hypothetical protein